MFPAPLCLASDQESVVISDLIGRAREAYNIERDLIGSEGHTATGVCERRLGLVKLAALKMYAQAQKQGLALSQDELRLRGLLDAELQLSVWSIYLESGASWIRTSRSLQHGL